MLSGKKEFHMIESHADHEKVGESDGVFYKEGQSDVQCFQRKCGSTKKFIFGPFRCYDEINHTMLDIRGPNESLNNNRDKTTDETINLMKNADKKEVAEDSNVSKNPKTKINENSSPLLQRFIKAITCKVFNPKGKMKLWISIRLQKSSI